MKDCPIEKDIVERAVAVAVAVEVGVGAGGIFDFDIVSARAQSII